MSGKQGSWADLYLKEDWWAIWLALGIILVALILFFAGSSLKPIAVSPPTWDKFSAVGAHFAEKWPWYLAQLAMWLVIFTVSVRVMGHKVNEYIPGFLILFALTVLILIFSSWKWAKGYNLEAPLVALILGLVAGNLIKLPQWLDTSLRTEYYIKTGIILLGATLPFTLIIKAGPVAFVQATIVSLSTFFAIFLIATRVFKLDPRFGAVMGAGGSVCGVSASIAVGGAVNAEKEHISISISLVTIFAIIMIFLLPIISKALKLDAGVAGAWIGNSEFADAAGFAAAQAIGDEKAIRAFTLMKVIGRDIWIGIWSFALAIIAVVYWEKKDRADAKVSAMEIWWRFPKFVLGFFVASIVISVVSLGYLEGSAYENMEKLLIGPIKTLRTWTFIFTFLCIGFTTRFKELARFGWPPLAAFTAGVIINVPLGFILSNYVFVKYWTETIK
ncbi:MAG TPA: putative sulfate exporter family transporter [bacterium]|nr:putative sulfate exporter family transporter [bacterium]